MTALAGLMLVNRGMLDTNAKGSKYWPEFAIDGKQDIEVRYILSHISGVCGWDEPVSNELLCYVEKSTAMAFHAIVLVDNRECVWLSWFHVRASHRGAGSSKHRKTMK